MSTSSPPWSRRTGGASNGFKKGENNHKNGNQYLAWAFLEAAHYAARYNTRAQAWLARKTARTLRMVAVKAEPKS